MLATVKTAVFLGVSLSAWIMTTADVPKAEEVQWVSLDFKTILTWTTKTSNHKFTVLYSGDDSDWLESQDCIQISESECDLTHNLLPLNRNYSADIQTESESEYNDDPEFFPHTLSPHFNPYKQSNISAVNFTVKAVDEHRVIINITDPLTSIHEHGKQLSIRDVLKNDLKYKIIYYKSGSTGKKDIISDSSIAVVPDLDAGENYCFMAAAFIPSRPKTTRQGAWSIHSCTTGNKTIVQELGFEAWVGIVILLAVIIAVVTVLYCKCCRQRNKTFHTSQSSPPV